MILSEEAFFNSLGIQAPECWKGFSNEEPYQPVVTKLEESMEYALCPEAFKDSVYTSVKLLEQSPEYARLFTRLQQCFWTEPVYAVGSWPNMDTKQSPRKDLIYLLLLIDAVPKFKEHQAQRSIPDQISRDTLSDIWTWVEHDHQKYGEWAFDRFSWLCGHLRSTITTLGRLQFEREDQMGLKAIALKKKDEDLWVCCVDGEYAFREDGQFDPTEEVQTGGFKSSFQSLDSEFVGHVIHSDGYVLKNKTSFLKEEWECVMESGCSVLSVHIPASGPLDMEACRESFDQSVEFYERFYPNFKYSGYTCQSWMLDSQLAQVLPSTKNLVRFLKKFYRIPVPWANDRQLRERVFGDVSIQWDEVEAETSLQKAVLKHVREGGEWRSSGGIVFKKPLSWGLESKFYVD